MTNKVIVTTLIITSIIVALLLYTNKNYLNNIIDYIAQKNNLTLKIVKLKNRINTPKNEILKTINPKIGKSMFTIDINQIRKDLENIGWIKNATVERKFPNTIFIEITELTPKAIWQYNKKLYLIDVDGEIISRRNIQKFSHLKLLIGRNANKKVSEFMELININPIIKKITTSGIYISNRRWDIILLNKFTVKLPDKNTKEALQTLLKYIKERNILSKNINNIDLRIPNKIFLRKTPKEIIGNKI